LSVAELETRGLVKRYGGLLANDRVDLAVASGEIHAVMGENGAGKTTLMNMLYGLQRPDEGRILLRGREVRLRSPLDAIANGLGMVHQAFRLFASLSVWENVVYGAEPRMGAFLDARAARRQVRDLAEAHGLQVAADAVVGELSVGARQRVEILKALYRQARILILDEPTAVLTPGERDGLFSVLRRLADEGRTILFVTHKLNEVMAITHRVTVLRDGRVAARLTTRQTTPGEIVRAMTGRNVEQNIARGDAPPGRPLIEVEGLTVASTGGKAVVDNVSFQVRAGEIVGVAGVAGNGQNELVEALAGLRRADAGEARIAGTAVASASVAAHRRAGLAYIPEDRALIGSALAGDAVDNLSMGFQRASPCSRRGLLDVGAMAARARELIGRFGVKIAGERARVSSLSGGNLQKLVVARELAHEAPALIAEQPTRGVDIGATEFIHKQLIAERDKGRAVLMVSAELSEILALSDRVLVMYEGRLLAELSRAQADEQRVGLLMAGRTTGGDLG
jgi:general nucleoside transport system ATP-binding protein